MVTCAAAQDYEALPAGDFISAVDALSAAGHMMAVIVEHMDEITARREQSFSQGDDG
ncbi:MAG: hypothetical protein ACLSFZ_05085 [Frisingicoccus sp.]